MKRSLVLSNCALLLVLTGCQEPSRYSMSPGSVEVFVEGGGEFPQFLVGKWVGNNGWGIAFETDGTITRARIPMGTTVVIPGKVTTLPTRGGGKAIYVPGDWAVTYSPAGRELTVEIAMNYIRIEMGSRGVFQGKIKYFLTATVPEDGPAWEATEHAFPDFEGFYDDPKDLPYTTVITLQRVEEEQ